MLHKQGVILDEQDRYVLIGANHRYKLGERSEEKEISTIMNKDVQKKF